MILIPVTATIFASLIILLWMMGKDIVRPSAEHNRNKADLPPNRPPGSSGKHASRFSRQQSQRLLVVISIKLFIIGACFRFVPAMLMAVILPFFPVIFRWRKTRYHRQMINDQMDSMFANLANAVSVTGNLSNAIEDVAEGEPEPMQSELKQVLHQIRLGSSEDDALQKMAERIELPLFRTAITAMIVGKRSGGRLAQILSDTAGSIRELQRLDGVLKTKTAEGRIQAWVMGLVPFFLCGALQLINPEWLVPLWTTPFGWVLLGCAFLLEIFAVVLIRKILAVVL